MQNPTSRPCCFRVRDTTLKTKPMRMFAVAVSGNAYDLWIYSQTEHPKVLERLDLRSEEAASRLAQFERI